MRVEATPEGLFLPEAGVHLDPALPVDVALVSHGHSDHARALSRTFHATPETVAVARRRLGETEYVPHAYGEPFELPGCRVTFFPSGHVLGAAAILVECGGERLLYTGDVKLRPSLTCAPADLPRCDTLITEATFGLPVYRFPSTDELRAQVVREARAALDEGAVPVFLAYALGKGPEVAAILGAAGIAVSLHGAIHAMAEVYRLFGVEVPGEAYERGKLEGRALVVTPSCRTHPMVTSLKSKRIVAVSGWALLDAAYDRYGADGLVPLSDHADWDELLEIVERSGARRVVTTHGYAAPFARVLALRGYESEALALPHGEEA